MEWSEITVYTNTLASEIISDVLTEFGSDGVSIYDSQDLINILKSDTVWDYVDEHLIVDNKVVRVLGYFAQDIDNEALIARLELVKKLCGFECGSLEISQRKIDEEDWANVWKQYYKPIHIGNVTIMPIWLKHQAKTGENVVLMDPGKAFGTGEHESTKMCIQMLTQIDVKDKIVLDIGCGSGILGIAALKCGAKQGYFADIDPIAVDAARYNARLNKIDNAIIENDDLLSNTDIKGDVIFANITADILIHLSTQISNALCDGGIIILSGIIKKRYQEVLDAYLAQGYVLLAAPELGEWRGIMLQTVKTNN